MYTISPSLGHMVGPTLLLLQMVVDHDSLLKAVLVYRPRLLTLTLKVLNISNEVLGHLDTPVTHHQ